MVDATLDTIDAALRAVRLPMDTESRLQVAIFAALLEAGFPVETEHRLDPKSRIDFLVGSIGIEAKIGGGRLAVWRQLERYAAFPALTALILVGSVVIPAGVTECGGKPFRHVSIGKGWL